MRKNTMVEMNTDEAPKKTSISTRIVSGTVGAIITSLVVTPFEVVKVLTQQQQEQHVHGITSPSSPLRTTVTTTKRNCPKGCGTFTLYNGHADCVLSKMSVPYFHKTTGTALTDGILNNTGMIPNPVMVGTFNRNGMKHPVSSIGAIGMLRHIYQQKGLMGIYAGLRPTLIMAAPNTIMYYTAYEEIVYQTRQQLNTSASTRGKTSISGGTGSYGLTTFIQKNENWLLPLFAGGSARLFSSTLTAPLEYLRTRQAAAIGNSDTIRDRSTISISPQRTGNLYHEFRNIVRNEGGISTLYRGLRPTLWRDVPFSALYWLLLEQFRSIWDRTRTVGTKVTPFEQTFESFINGAVSGMIAAAFTTPFDVAKTRQQTAMIFSAPAASTSIQTPPVAAIFGTEIQNGTLVCSHVSSTTGNSNKALSIGSGTFHQLRLIAQTEGIRGLWRGNQARMLKVAPSCAIMLSSYELGKRLLE